MPLSLPLSESVMRLLCLLLLLAFTGSLLLSRSLFVGDGLLLAARLLLLDDSLPLELLLLLVGLLLCDLICQMMAVWTSCRRFTRRWSAAAAAATLHPWDRARGGWLGQSPTLVFWALTGRGHPLSWWGVCRVTPNGDSIWLARRQLRGGPGRHHWWRLGWGLAWWFLVVVVCFRQVAWLRCWWADWLVGYWRLGWGHHRQSAGFTWRLIWRRHRAGLFWATRPRTERNEDGLSLTKVDFDVDVARGWKDSLCEGVRDPCQRLCWVNIGQVRVGGTIRSP